MSLLLLKYKFSIYTSRRINVINIARKKNFFIIIFNFRFFNYRKSNKYSKVRLIGKRNEEFLGKITEIRLWRED